MTIGLYTLIGVVLALGLGILVGYFVSLFVTSKKVNTARQRAEKLMSDAKNEAQDVLLEAKSNAIKLLEDAKKEEQERNKQIGSLERILIKKESELDEKAKQLTGEKKQIEDQQKEVEKIKLHTENARKQQIDKLQKIANLTKEEAKNQLISGLEREYEEEIYQKLQKLETGSREELDRKSKEILTMSVQRYAGSHISDATTTTISLPSDELKGKIIGKEGRNIKTIERLTGVDIIIDDTPETLVISGFDPVRRQIAKIALEKLMADGRIHPAKIEEMVEKAKEEIHEKIQQAGEAALFEVGVGTVDTKLAFLLGRLAFRTSFGQNVLIHSIEMAHVAGMLASELGLDVPTAKKGALFHDIGKAVDHEVQGTHVEIGRKILQKFNVGDEVIRAMEPHHEEYPYTTLESRIVQAADAISASRPGARRDTVEVYLKRLEDLERIANEFDGVDKSYAVQAGRELRIFVIPTEIDDLTAMKMARDMAKKIEAEMKYPGEIKVTVIRETRAIEYAR